MHHDPDRSWITDPGPDHPRVTHRVSCELQKKSASKGKNHCDALKSSLIDLQFNLSPWKKKKFDWL